MTTITAKTILRSRNLAKPEHVVSTLLLRYPRPIHAEFMTHGQLRKNSASSRAVPVEKVIASIQDDPFEPLHWGANQKGMQADHECNELVDIGPMMGFHHPFTVSREVAWLHGRDQMVMLSKAFADAGYHKQVANRLTEPWAHITVVVTATEWTNFLALRTHKDAEPHFQILAQEIKKCLDNDPIQDLKPGEWHRPFVDFYDPDHGFMTWSGNNEQALCLSVAKCASTSYKTVEGFDFTMKGAIALHDKLRDADPMHASPFEHQCQADEWFMTDTPFGVDHRWENPEQHGPMVGFRQYRKMLPNECR